MGGAVQSKQLEQRLKSIAPADLENALQRQGLRGVTPRQLARVLSGQDRAGWSAGKLAGATKALQSVGVASSTESIGRILVDSTKRAQQDHEMHVARQTTKNTALDFSKQSLSSRVAAQRFHRESGSSVEQAHPVESGRSIREIRDLLRHRLGLSQKPIVPKPGFGREKPTTNPFDKP
jgi:hypothetical protein